MQDRIINVFFYGLFMDADWLKTQGFTPTEPRPARVDDFDLFIGDRATLAPMANASVYGVVMGLPLSQIDTLYAEPSVKDYRPEAVLAVIDEQAPIAALCYNLPSADSSGANPNYAERLLELAQRLNFPKTYLDRIRKFI